MTSETLLDILNNLSELIYVADIETHELIYLNDAGMKAFHVDKIDQQKCYKVLQGRDEPCEFCTNDNLKKDNYYTWQYCNPITGITYLLKDKIICWEDKNARIEIAFNNEDQLKREEAMHDLLDIETVIVKCITELHRQADIYIRIQNVLNIVGKFMSSDRAYIFMIEDCLMYNTFEWCRENIVPQIDNLQGIDVHEIDRWMEIFLRGECVLIDDLEEVQGTQEYNTLKIQNINNLFVVPLESDGKIIGYMGVDNPQKEKVKKAKPFFTTLSYFVSSSIIRQQNETLLQQMSYNDSLTGLYNRNKYNEDLLELIKKDKVNLGIVYIDMNGLKAINDLAGHSSGDRALIHVANILLKNFDREGIYRLGGDEFIILEQQCSQVDFLARVRTLRKYFQHEDCSVAIGYDYVVESQYLQEAIKKADEVMYEDKKEYYRHSLTKRYRYYNDDFAELTNQRHLINLIRNNRFTIDFQPKIILETRSVYGAEALLRYHDEHNQVVAPNQFVPLLENHGLIYILDFYVLDSVCRLQTQWQVEGYSILPISVNLSRMTLNHPQFFEYLDKLWGKYNLSKNDIEFEITEDSPSDINNDTPLGIQEMKKRGFRIAIDDFGSKQANIFLFSTIDFDVMKLDKSLVDSLKNNPKIYSLIKSIIDICHELGISIVAEGVETQELLTILEEMGCDQVQGYLFSRPIALSDYKKNYIENKNKSIFYDL